MNEMIAIISFSFLVEFDVLNLNLHLMAGVILRIDSTFEVMSIMSLVLTSPDKFAVNEDLNFSRTSEVLDIDVEPVVVDLVNDDISSVYSKLSIVNSKHQRGGVTISTTKDLHN